MSYAGNSLVITGLMDNSKVVVYTIQGDKIADIIAPEGDVVIDNISSGFYIIVVDGIAYKMKL